MQNNHRFAWPVRPVAQGENCVTGKHYRFTVLTDRLIRMEYDPAGIFENRASQTVFYRDLPVCSFEARRENGFLRIDTGALLLTYREEAPFAADTLRVQLLSEPAATWNFGDAYEDLGGTCKTLDEADGPRPVEKGLCSRWGFSVLDDSKTLLLDETGAVSEMPAVGGKPVNTVGAGDSMVAGFIAGVEQGYEYALKLGSAAGGATACQAGLAKAKDIEALLKEI